MEGRGLTEEGGTEALNPSAFLFTQKPNSYRGLTRFKVKVPLGLDYNPEGKGDFFPGTPIGRLAKPVGLDFGALDLGLSLTQD